MAKWIAHSHDMRGSWFVPQSGQSLTEDPLLANDIECKWWCIHPGFKTHGQSQPKSETESTSGSTKWWHCYAKKQVLLSVASLSSTFVTNEALVLFFVYTEHLRCDLAFGVIWSEKYHRSQWYPSVRNVNRSHLVWTKPWTETRCFMILCSAHGLLFHWNHDRKCLLKANVEIKRDKKTATRKIGKNLVLRMCVKSHCLKL